LTREPSFEELIGAETTGEERERLRQTHELLLQAGPPAELPPGLQKAPQIGVVSLQERRRVMKQRTLLVLAAALAVVAVFFAGYAVSNQRHNSSVSGRTLAKVVSLKGTARAPGAKGELEVWHPSAGNWPMKLRVSGLTRLPPRFYYAVYWVRDGRILAPCGQFRVDGPQALTVSLNAPYPLQPGDTWVVTRQGPGGAEPGQKVLRPVTA
jgi:hypothetical protein